MHEPRLGTYAVHSAHKGLDEKSEGLLLLEIVERPGGGALPDAGGEGREQGRAAAGVRAARGAGAALRGGLAAHLAKGAGPPDRGPALAPVAGRAVGARGRYERLAVEKRKAERSIASARRFEHQRRPVKVGPIGSTFSA